MKYFLDTEFHERVGKPKGWFTKKQWMIELISIGIVAEDGREYYSVSKDFDLKAAWNNEWLRENVLRKIHKDLSDKVGTHGKTYFPSLFEDFTIKSLKRLIKWYGKPNTIIAFEVKHFTNPFLLTPNLYKHYENETIEFYAYYADYDWVVLCSQLFGSMMQLPKRFPMYCRDVKQMLDEKFGTIANNRHMSLKQILDEAKSHRKYPKNTNEHHALADAKFDKELYNFINTL